MRGPAWIVVATIVSAVVAAPGCGGDERREVQRALLDLRLDYLAERYGEACDHLTRGAQREVGSIGHVVPTTCPRDMAEHMSARVVSAADMAGPRVRSVEVDGDAARADAVAGDGTPLRLALAREDGAWKLARVFGGSARPGTGKRDAVPSLRRGSVVATALEPRGGGPATACPELRVRAITADGGCAMTARGRIDMTVVSAFGDRLYARCDLDLEILVDSRAELIVNDLGNGGGPGAIGDTCGDIYSCRNADGEHVLWRGRIVRARDGRLELAIANACLGTCLGRFAGGLVLRVAERPGGRIELVARGSGLGDSGLALSGTWAVEPEPSGTSLEIRD